jgi:hypothetical protein
MPRSMNRKAAISSKYGISGAHFMVRCGFHFQHRHSAVWTVCNWGSGDLKPSIFIVALLVPSALLLSSCGTFFTGSLSAAPMSSPAISISPSTCQVAAGQTLQFTANLTGYSNALVSWAVNGVVGGTDATGTVSSDGLYQAPSSAKTGQQMTITATSEANKNEFASATLTIHNTTAINPASVTLAIGETQLFSATVNGTSSSDVLWTVEGIPGGNTELGTISPSGLYTTPAVVPSSKMNVAAVDASDSLASAAAILTIFDPAVMEAHDQWLRDVAEAAKSYGCTTTVEQLDSESVAKAISQFGSLASEGSCLILRPVSTDPDSIIYSLAWGGAVDGIDILYITDVSRMRIWNGVEVANN